MGSSESFVAFYEFDIIKMLTLGPSFLFNQPMCLFLSCVGTSGTQFGPVSLSRSEGESFIFSLWWDDLDGCDMKTAS